MEQEVGIREQLEYCISLEELAAKLRIAGATKFLAEKIEGVSKTVDQICKNSKTSRKYKENVDKVVSEYKIRIEEMKTEYANLIKQSEVKIQDCESKEVKCISAIAQMQQGSKELIAKQKNELKENYEKKVEQAKDLKNTDPVIMYLRAKKMLADVKKNSILYMDIKEYEKVHTIFLQAQQNEEVRKYLSLMEEIPSLKKDIKYLEKAKSEIQEYDGLLKQISKLKKDGNIELSNKVLKKVKEMEKNSSVIQEYKEAKDNLKSTQKSLDEAKAENIKLKTEYKKQPDNIKAKYIKKIKENNSQIQSLQNRENECKEGLRQFKETDTEVFKRDVAKKQKRFSELKNSPDLEIYFKCEKEFKKKQRNEKLFHEVEAYITAKDDLSKAKMNTNVAEYLSLINEISQLKIQIKESKKGKSTNIIKEYEDAVKTANKFGKAGKMNEYREAMRNVREKESNAIVQEYKANKEELTTIREELENAQNLRAGTIVQMNTQLEQLSRPVEQSLAVIEKVNPIKKIFSNITSKLNLGSNTEKNVISPIMTVSNKLMEISQGIRTNAEQNFRQAVTEIFHQNDLEKCSTIEIIGKFTTKKKIDSQRVNPLNSVNNRDTKVFQKNNELDFAR